MFVGFFRWLFFFLFFSFTTEHTILSWKAACFYRSFIETVTTHACGKQTQSLTSFITVTHSNYVSKKTYSWIFGFCTDWRNK